jgi:hypothetical protein
MLHALEDSVASVGAVVAAMDSDSLPAEEASRFVDLFGELERLATAGRTIAGRSVEKSRLWWQQGYRTPAMWMASHAQTTVGSAITTLETGRALEELPATRERFRSGTLSAMQAAEIARAAAADSDAERQLLDAAESESVAGLRELCRAVVAASNRDPDSDERIHRSRYLRHWSDPDGAVRLDARLTPDAGARVVAAIRARGRTLLERARASGAGERRAAYAADALVALATESAPGSRAVVHVHVDERAWTRGRTERGESCQVAGLAPVSVAAARRLAEDGIVKTVLWRGADVRAVAHLGRTIPARLRTALEARDQTCVVPRCDEREGLEIDHILPLADGGPTRLDNLARLCHWHHSLKTHRGWRLAGGPGRWRWFKAPRAATRGAARMT